VLALLVLLVVLEVGLRTRAVSTGGESLTLIGLAEIDQGNWIAALSLPSGHLTRLVKPPWRLRSSDLDPALLLEGPIYSRGGLVTYERELGPPPVIVLVHWVVRGRVMVRNGTVSCGSADVSSITCSPDGRYTAFLRAGRSAAREICVAQWPDGQVTVVGRLPPAAPSSWDRLSCGNAGEVFLMLRQSPDAQEATVRRYSSGSPPLDLGDHASIRTSRYGAVAVDPRLARGGVGWELRLLDLPGFQPQSFEAAYNWAWMPTLGPQIMQAPGACSADAAIWAGRFRDDRIPNLPMTGPKAYGSHIFVWRLGQKAPLHDLNARGRDQTGAYWEFYKIMDVVSGKMPEWQDVQPAMSRPAVRRDGSTAPGRGGGQ